MIVQLVFAITFFTIASYGAATSVLCERDAGLRNALKMVRSKKSQKTNRARRGIENHANFPERMIAKLVRQNPERREIMRKKMLRGGVSGAPEEFIASAVIRALMIASLAPVFWLLGIKIASLGCAVLSLAIYAKRFGDLDARLKKTRTAIEDELPRFVSVINYSMATDRDITRTIGRYLKICKPAFHYDLELLYLELRGGNAEDALKRFDSRVDIPQLSAFISGLIDAGRGVDQKTFFYLMEENMKQLFIANKRRELATRPAKIKRAIIAAGLCLFILYLVPIGIQLARGFTIFQ